MTTTRRNALKAVGAAAAALGAGVSVVNVLEAKAQQSDVLAVLKIDEYVDVETVKRLQAEWARGFQGTAFEGKVRAIVVGKSFVSVDLYEHTANGEIVALRHKP